MTSNQIKSAALHLFTDNGYEGTSMAQLATEVGIKKQSIYTHFKGKDDLFLALFHDVFTAESQFVIDYVESNKSRPIKEFLFDFLFQYKNRFEESYTAKFWLRNAFFPPSHLYEQVIDKVYIFLDQLEAYFLPVIKNAIEEEKINSKLSAEHATIAYLGVLDAIFVEMLYGGTERLMKRLDASWDVYWRGVSTD